MHAIKTQSQLADATADMMRACALLAARTASLSASGSLSLWAQMMAASAGSPWTMQSLPAWSPVQGWTAWNRACVAPMKPEQAEAAAEPVTAPVAPDPAFASYRSAGGHAVAQVIVG
jgi:hypothetical protein